MTRRVSLEALEHFMLADDRREHPMTFAIRAEISGELVQTQLIRAVEDAKARHPLLCMTVVGKSTELRTALRWEASSLAAFVDVAMEGTPLRPPGRTAAIDLTRELPFRIYVRQGRGCAQLLIQMHHAAADATGAVRFLEDIVAAYARLSGETVAQRPLDPALLAARGTFHLSKRDWRKRLLRDLGRAFLFFRIRPKPLAADLPARRPFVDADWPASHSRTFDPSAVEDLRSGAKAHGATLNDRLLAEMFMTVDEWNREHGGPRRVRLAMAINMRRPEDDHMPAANIVSMAFLDRTPGAIQSGSLLASVVAETQYIKRHSMGFTLLRVATWCGNVRRGVKELMTPRWYYPCSSTVVLSNLGQPLASSPLPRDAEGRITAGGLTLLQLCLMPPVRPGTAVAFGVVTYAGRMTITAHYDQTVLSPKGAELLLVRYASALRQTMVDATGRVKGLAGKRAKDPFRSLPFGKNVAWPEPPKES